MVHRRTTATRTTRNGHAFQGRGTTAVAQFNYHGTITTVLRGKVLDSMAWIHLKLWPMMLLYHSGQLCGIGWKMCIQSLLLAKDSEPRFELSMVLSSVMARTRKRSINELDTTRITASNLVYLQEITLLARYIYTCLHDLPACSSCKYSTESYMEGNKYIKLK